MPQSTQDIQLRSEEVQEILTKVPIAIYFLVYKIPRCYCYRSNGNHFFTS